jgi:flagellar motor switch protein FliN/FliY
MADDPENAAQDEDPSAGEKILAPDDIEALLGHSSKRPAAPSPRTNAPEPGVAQRDLDLLLQQAEAALASIDEPGGAKLPEGISPFHLEAFSGAPASAEIATLELIRDVELDLRIELGRTHMYLEDVLKLRKGSVVPLDKLAGDPVDIYVNGRLIARGEVLVLNDNFCVRVAELISGERAAG